MTMFLQHDTLQAPNKFRFFDKIFIKKHLSITHRSHVQLLFCCICKTRLKKMYRTHKTLQCVKIATTNIRK